MKTYYVYIVECSDKSYYTGVTNDVDRRLNEHNSGAPGQAYTSRRQPVILKFCERFNDITQAIALEKQIKGWSRRKKEALINENWHLLVLFSKSYQDGAIKIEHKK